MAIHLAVDVQLMCQDNCYSHFVFGIGIGKIHWKIQIGFIRLLRLIMTVLKNELKLFHFSLEEKDVPEQPHYLIYNQLHLTSHLFYKYVAKFRETGSVHHKQRTIENSIRSEAVEVAVLGHIAILSP